MLDLSWNMGGNTWNYIVLHSGSLPVENRGIFKNLFFWSSFRKQAVQSHCLKASLWLHVIRFKEYRWSEFDFCVHLLFCTQASHQPHNTKTKLGEGRKLKSQKVAYVVEKGRRRWEVEGREALPGRPRGSHSNGWDVYGLVSYMSTSELFFFIYKQSHRLLFLKSCVCAHRAEIGK